MTARLIGVAFGKGLVFAAPFGAWAFGYYFWALGACFECSVGAAITYALGAAALIPLFVLGSSGPLGAVCRCTSSGSADRVSSAWW